ncbi:MAG: arginine--tRNA ligase [Candidatus Saccharibacteria bacterium]
MKQELEQAVAAAVKDLFGVEVDAELTRPDEQFGDYATNVALQLGKQLGKNPREIAEQLRGRLASDGQFASVTVAGPGFLNLKLTDEKLIAALRSEPAKPLAGESWVVEYSCPNAFKELHTGHLYNTIAGDVLARLLERAGADMHRTSFGSDVGLNVGRCMWGILHELGGENPDALSKVSDDPLERANWLSKCYVAGATIYEEDDAAKQQIIALNQAVYRIHAENDHDSPLARIYWKCRQWSFDYFDAFYKLIKVDAMRYYPESETTERGLRTVREQLAKGLLEESEGAVVFHGDESEHLHTRVFITSKGLPTYETKDVGVILAEQEEYNFDHRVLITGNDQTEYMRVVFAAMDTFFPGIGDKMTHLTNGTVRFGDGKKMSSRLGNVSRAIDVVTTVRERAIEMLDDQNLLDDITLGAIKYEFLKYRLGGDIAFDVNESVSLQGNSGPYLQYAHARARSILAKSPDSGHSEQSEESTLEQILHSVQDDGEGTRGDGGLQADERSLLRKITEYTEVVDKATVELMPHHICTYLYELAQKFNQFYEHNRVIGDERETVRLALVGRYADTLKNGLGLLGITAPDRM